MSENKGISIEDKTLCGELDTSDVVSVLEHLFLETEEETQTWITYAKTTIRQKY